MSRNQVQMNKMKLRLAVVLIRILRLAADISVRISLFFQPLKGSVKAQDDSRWTDASRL